MKVANVCAGLAVGVDGRLVTRVGIEPTTYGLKGRCSTN